MGENGNLIEINRKANELALVTVTRIATLNQKPSPLLLIYILFRMHLRG